MRMTGAAIGATPLAAAVGFPFFTLRESDPAPTGMPAFAGAAGRALSALALGASAPGFLAVDRILPSGTARRPARACVPGWPTDAGARRSRLIGKSLEIAVTSVIRAADVRVDFALIANRERVPGTPEPAT